MNLCEKLAGCPRGTKLWSPLFGECEFVTLGDDIDNKTNYFGECIVITCNELGLIDFDKHGHYYKSSEECLLFPSKDNRDWDSWECPKPKVERFDRKTLQPFDKVLVRDSDDVRWRADFFSYFEPELEYPVLTVVSSWRQAVPYNENTKHLLGTKDEAPEYYRWWEEKA